MRADLNLCLMFGAFVSDACSQSRGAAVSELSGERCSSGGEELIQTGGAAGRLVWLMDVETAQAEIAS